MIIPNPVKSEIVGDRKVLVVEHLYCSNGHDFISNRVIFNGYPGLLIKVKQDESVGFVALSPFYGEHSRFSLDIDLKDQKILSLMCPVCGKEQPIIAPCSCGGNLIAFFLTKMNDFQDCVGICNRVNCPNSRLVNSGELITRSMLESL